MEPGGYEDEITGQGHLRWRTDAFIVMLAVVLVAWLAVSFLL